MKTDQAATPTNPGDTAPLAGGYADLVIVEPSEFDAVEVQPITTWPSPGNPAAFDCEVCDDPADADYWSVYVHCREGGVECIGDFLTQAEAEDYAGQIAERFGYTN